VAFLELLNEAGGGEEAGAGVVAGLALAGLWFG
jgi:hypothetical protein